MTPPHTIQPAKPSTTNAVPVPEGRATELRATEARYEALVASAADAIVSADADGTITHFNPAAERMFGLAAGDAVGQCLTVLMPDALPMIRDPRLVGKTVEVTGRRDDGSAFPLEISLSTWSADGEASFTAVLRDITARRAMGREVRRLAAVVKSSDDAIVSSDRHGLITTWNPGAERTFCYSADEVLGRHISLLSPLGTPPEGPGVMERVLGGQHVEPYETQRLRRDGAVIEVSVSLSPVAGENDAPGGTAAIVRDITARKEEEKTTRHLGSIVESSEDAIMSKTLDGTIVIWNAGAERLYGYTAEEAVGRSIRLIVPPDHHDEIDTILANIRRGEPVERLETTRLRKDGTRVEVSLTVSPIRDESGRLVGASAIARDISESKRMESALIDAKGELQRSNRDLLQFASIASHELVEPVRVVAGYSELLQRRYEGKLDDDADRFIDALASGAARMQILIHDLLDFSRVGRDSKPMAMVDCAELMRDVLASLEQRVAETGATVSVGELPSIKGAQDELGRVFQNLILNALKFRSEAPPEIHVDAERNGIAWVFSIRDNGIGIDPAQAERIFEMFQRLHGREEYAGTGMGLAIVKRIVERHGGRIWAEQADGGGTVFRFSLPHADFSRSRTA